LGTDGTVIVFVEPASAPFWTGVAHIRSLVSFGAVVIKRDEILAKIVAPRAALTFLLAEEDIIAHMLTMTVSGKCTAYGRFVVTVVFLKYAVFFDLLGYRSWILAQFCRNGTKGTGRIQTLFNNDTIFLVHVFLIGL